MLTFAKHLHETQTTAEANGHVIGFADNFDVVMALDETLRDHQSYYS